MVYFISFMVIGAFVMLNLIVAGATAGFEPAPPRHSRAPTRARMKAATS